MSVSNALGLLRLKTAADAATLLRGEGVLGPCQAASSASIFARWAVADGHLGWESLV